MNSTCLEWKNSPDLYNDYEFLENCPWAMQRILAAYGWFFDDNYFYWIPKHRTGQLSNIVKRRPLYWYPQKSTPSEKPKGKHKLPLEVPSK